MLLVASFESKSSAKKFYNYLLSLNIDSKMDHSDSYDVWVIHDYNLDKAKLEYKGYLENPDDDKYKIKQNIRDAQNKKSTSKLKASYRRNFGRHKTNILTVSLIVIAIVVFVLQQSPLQSYASYLLIGIPRVDTVSLWLNQPWRLLTPMFLHFSLLHIIFNLYWLYSLGFLIESKESRLFYVSLVLSCDLVANILQLMFVGPLFGGLSGVVYGLFGYIWLSAKFNAWSGYYVRSDVIFWMVGWLILGFTGMLGHIANFAHLGGLVVGALFALIKKHSK